MFYFIFLFKLSSPLDVIKRKDLELYFLISAVVSVSCCCKQGTGSFIFYFSFRLHQLLLQARTWQLYLPRQLTWQLYLPRQLSSQSDVVASKDLATLFSYFSCRLRQLLLQARTWQLYLLILAVVSVSCCCKQGPGSFIFLFQLSSPSAVVASKDLAALSSYFSCRLRQLLLQARTWQLYLLILAVVSVSCCCMRGPVSFIFLLQLSSPSAVVASKDQSTLFSYFSCRLRQLLLRARTWPLRRQLKPRLLRLERT